MLDALQARSPPTHTASGQLSCAHLGWLSGRRHYCASHWPASDFVSMPFHVHASLDLQPIAPLLAICPRQLEPRICPAGRKCASTSWRHPPLLESRPGCTVARLPPIQLNSSTGAAAPTTPATPVTTGLPWHTHVHRPAARPPSAAAVLDPHYAPHLSHLPAPRGPPSFQRKPHA